MKKPSNSSSIENLKTPAFLADLIGARSPSGYENEAREVIKNYVEKQADEYFVDALGN